jgi:nucleoid-associated protein YgaU
MAEPEPMAEPMVQESGDGTLSYTVVRGDTLWDIASYRVIYGNPYQWPLIFKANSDQIDDADLIEPEQVLMIPNASASEIEAAIQHAKTRGAWSLGVIEESDLAFLRQ